MNEVRIIQAHYVISMIDDPIIDGAIAFAGDRIVDLGSKDDINRKYRNAETIDLGNRILMPALVNAHTHVSLTDAGLISGDDFLDWLKNLMPWMYSCTPADLLFSSMAGLNGMLKAGITTIGDSFFSYESMKAALVMKFRGIFFHEVFGISAPFQCHAIMKYRREMNIGMKLATAMCRLGISPHALYTVTPAVMKFANDFSRKNEMRISMHVAESQGELEFLRSSSGQFRHQFTPNVKRIPTTSLPPLEYLDSFGIVNERFIAIHGVHLTESEFELLARRKGHFVTCPSSNANLKTGRLDLRKPLNAGVNICVGTDSPASSNGIDLFKELRPALRIGEPDEIKIDSRDALAMITRNPAKALGFENEIGTIEAGKCADLIALEIPRNTSESGINIEDWVVRNSGADDVALTISSGIVRYSRIPEIQNF